MKGKQLAAWCFVGAVCGMLVGAVWLAEWSRRVEHSATTEVWGGMRRPGRMLYEVVRDGDRLRFEFRKRKYLEEVMRRLDWEQRRGIPMDRGVRELEEIVEVGWKEGGWVEGWGAIEVTAWQSSEDEAREVVRTLADVFWDTTIAEHRAKERADFEVVEEELRQAEVQLEGWMALMRDLLPEEDGSRRYFTPESYRTYSSYLEVVDAYHKARRSLSSLKLQQIMRKSSLARTKPAFVLPGMVEMGERRAKRNGPGWLICSVLAGAGIGVGGYAVATSVAARRGSG